MNEDLNSFNSDPRPWCFAMDILLKPGTKLFIFEDGTRIGLGKVVANNDIGMWVRIEFTQAPKSPDLYYGILTDFIDKE